MRWLGISRKIWMAALLSAVVLLGSYLLTLSFWSNRSDTLPDAVIALVPDIEFEDAAGALHQLSDFRGKAVLLNVWATWCVPCRKEMPALDRLEAELRSPEFEVVAVSIDLGGLRAVQPFFAEARISSLDIYFDATGSAYRELGFIGLPGTLLVDPSGREIRRWVGPAEWDSPEMVALVREELRSATVGADGPADIGVPNKEQPL